MEEEIIAVISRKNVIKSDQIYVTNKSNVKRLQYLKDKYNINYSQDKKTIIDNADIIILSVKPADITSAIHSFKDFTHSDQLIISVIAGVTTEDIETEV